VCCVYDSQNKQSVGSGVNEPAVLLPSYLVRAAGPRLRRSSGALWCHSCLAFGRVVAHHREIFHRGSRRTEAQFGGFARIPTGDQIAGTGTFGREVVGAFVNQR
jgi:hypothetical protein